MMDIKLNGNTYNDVERVRLVRADGLGVYSVVEVDMLDAALADTTYETEYYNSVATKIAKWPFTNVSKVNFPNVRSVVSQIFYGKKIVEARLPALESSPGQIFLNGQQLKKAIFGPKLSALGGQDFRSCIVLETLVLPYEGVVSFTAGTTGSATFTDSAVVAGTAYIYVPASQVDAYKADANWSAYADQIRAIEDYPDEVV